MNFLEKVRIEKEKEVKLAKKKLPLARIKKGLAKSKKSFKKAISGKGIKLIAELKKASPSNGLIKKDFDVKKLAKLYAKYADAVSVLTDEKIFKGKKEYLKIASKESKLPVLRKDFIIDEYQIYESRYYGADAILLISELLTEEKLNKFIGIAKSLGMDCLVEAENEDSLKKTLESKAQIIGINNRDLHTLKVDVTKTEKLIRKSLKSKRKKLCLVAESGINSFLQVRQLKGKIDAVLVGSSIMQAKNPETKLRELKAMSLVKVCGITNKIDAKQASTLGVDMLGFNFFKESPRYIKPKEAKKIMKTVPQMLCAGVFVNEKASNVNRIAKELDLDFVQLHGDEDNIFCRKIRKPVIKALRIEKKSNLRKLNRFDCTFILLDSFDKKNYGGTGKEIAFKISKLPENKLVFLSGGITPKNVEKKLELKPFAIDVCSGVEKEKGKKDYAKMKKLVEKVKGVYQ